MDEDEKVALILGCPFLANARAMIDAFDGKLTLRVVDEHVTFFVNTTTILARKQHDTLHYIDMSTSQVSKSLSSFPCDSVGMRVRGHEGEECRRESKGRIE